MVFNGHLAQLRIYSLVISLAAASYMNVKKPAKANAAAPAAAAQDIKIPDIKVPKK